MTELVDLSYKFDSSLVTSFAAVVLLRFCTLYTIPQQNCSNIGQMNFGFG
jgi:hypothetical protein